MRTSLSTPSPWAPPVPDKIPGGRKVSGVPLYQFLPAAVGSGAGPFLCKDRCAGEKLAQLCVGDRDVVGAAEIPHEACRLVEDLLRCLREEDLGSLFLLFGKQSTGDFTQGKFRRIGGIQLPEKVPAAGRVGGRDRDHRVAGAAAAQHIRLGRKDDDGVLHAVCVGQHGAADLFHQGRLAAAHVAHQHGGVLPAAAVCPAFRPPGRCTTGSTRPAVGGTVRCSCCPSKRRFIGFVLSFQVFLSYTQRKALPPCPVGKTAQKIKKAEEPFSAAFVQSRKGSSVVSPLRGVS